MTNRPLIIHQAKWVVPVDGPVLADGAVAVAGDRIVEVGPAAAIRQNYQTSGLGADEIVYYDHGEGAIIPALVNAHVHLEFSGLRHAIAPQEGLPAWLQEAIDGYRALTPGEIDQGIQPWHY